MKTIIYFDNLDDYYLLVDLIQDEYLVAGYQQPIDYNDDDLSITFMGNKIPQYVLNEFYYNKISNYETNIV